MREFSWYYFTLTGNIDAYLLYKRHERVGDEGEQDDATTFEVDADDA